MVSDVEKQAIDLSKPLSLYSSKIRLNLSEKLNLLERETVKIYQNKLAKMAASSNQEVSQTEDLE